VIASSLRMSIPVEEFFVQGDARLKLDFTRRCVTLALNPKLVYLLDSGVTGHRPDRRRNVRPMRRSSTAVVGVRYGTASSLSARPKAARGLLRHISRRRLTGGLCLGAPSAGVCTAAPSPSGPAIEVSDDGIDAQHDLETNSVSNSRQTEFASRCSAPPIETAGRLCDVAIASEKDVSGPAEVIGASGMDRRHRLRLCDPPQQWAEMMQGVESWSRAVNTERLSRRVGQEGCSSSGLSHRRRSLERIRRSPHAARRRLVEDAGGR